MSYSSTMSTTGGKHRLCAEYIGEAFSLEIALQDDTGKRIQFVRIPLNDFDCNDLAVFSAFVANCIVTTDAGEIDFLEQYDDDDSEDA